MSTFRVAVYNNHQTNVRQHINRPLAYTQHITTGACMHEIEADSASDAKRQAIKEHVNSSTCDQDDQYCFNCPGLNAYTLTQRGAYRFIIPQR